MLKQIAKKEFVESLEGTQFVNSYFNINTMEELVNLIDNTVACINTFLQQVKEVPKRYIAHRQTQAVKFSNNSWLDFSGKQKKCYKYTIKQGTWYIIIEADYKATDKLSNVIIYWKEE